MRKFLKRHLPHPDSLRKNRWLAMLGNTLFHPRLWHLNRHSAASAVAIGLFCGLVPGPLQMFSAAIACLVKRANLPLALLVTLYTNPITIVPLYLLAFGLGSFVTGSDAAFVAPPPFAWHSLGEAARDYWHWLLALGKPLAVGLPLFASLLAVTGYALVSLAWRWHLLRELRRRAQRTHSGT